MLRGASSTSPELWVVKWRQGVFRGEFGPDLRSERIFSRGIYQNVNK